MNTAPLPKEITDRIEKNAEDYVIRWGRTYNGMRGGEVRKNDYKSGATAEATRAQPLIEALKAWQNFDSRIHNSGDVALLHMKAHKALTEYNSQP